MDFATRKHYYNRCKTYESLAPDDERNVDLDQFGTEAVRGVNWVERLAVRFELSEEPALELFTGLTGSGKSTELRRLAARLARANGAHLLPVIVDAERVIDLTNPIDVPEIIASILHRSEECVLQAEGRDPADALTEGYLTRLWNWLTRTDVNLNKAEYAIPGGPKLIAEMKARPSLRERVRETVAAHLTTFLSEARKEMALFEDRSRVCGYNGLVVMFDSLEKLRGVSTNWQRVLDSAESLFAAGAPYLRLPVHVLYTIPTALIRRRFEHAYFMPMIKLSTPGGQPFEAGLAAARELVRRRVPDSVLQELLGPAAEARVTNIIRWSGGYPREIVRLLQAAFTISETPLTEVDLERIWNEVRDAYRHLVAAANAYDWLARLGREHYPVYLNEADHQIADLMMSNNGVLRYLNERDWYDLHPAVAEITEVVQARARIDGERLERSFSE